MVTRSPRSRSVTSAATSMSSNRRPISRQSTTSIQSNTTQPAPVHHTGASYQTGVGMPSALWDQHQQAQSQVPGLPLSSGGSHFMVESSLPSHAHGSFSQDAAAFQNGTDIHMALQEQITPIESKENGPFDVNVDNGTLGDNATDGAKRKKGSASSQANDNELRRLFRENESRDLHEVALQVIRDEKGPKAEKSKQVFGMLWLFTHTKKTNSSVPRNRVFSAYAKTCGNERVPPLNPASFGKLVRIIHPGITTRRLGVRGESKYHYVELSLLDDNRPEDSSLSRGRSMTIDIQRESTGSAMETSKPQLPADTASFSPVASPRKARSSTKCADVVISHLYPQISSIGDRNVDLASMIRRPLQFAPPSSASNHGETQLELPSIEPYLPPGTDVDAVDSLTSVYRSHCLLAIDNFRFCKTDKLCDSYKSLVGLLTVPGQKLLSHPNVASWLRACDWMKYQKMIPMLDQILLTQVPKKAMSHMEYVSTHVCNWISQFFQNQPQHTRDAMLAPTNLFASLLDRFLRVNRAALDVSHVLENVENRDELWRDWITHLKPLHVIQNSLLDRGHRRVLHILTQDVRLILSPLEATSPFLHDPLFVDTGILSDFQRDEFKLGSDSSSTIARLSRFMISLAPRFPDIDARSLLNYIDVIGNGVSRNMTLNGAPSLGNWWRVKLFVDEMSYWLAEKGGFLSSSPESLDISKTIQQTSQPLASLSGSNGYHDRSRSQTSAPTRAGSLQPGPSYGDNNHILHSHAHGFSSGIHGHERNQVDQQESNLEDHSRSRRGSTVIEQNGMGEFGDDSGIAMGLEDEFGMDTKYHSFVGGVNGSDPADVVVC